MNMKLIKPFIFSIALLLLLIKISFASYDRLFDQFGNLNCEDEMAHLDNLAIVSNNFPDHIIYIFVYADRNSRRGEAKARLTRIKNYLVYNRGLNINRLKLEDGGHREDFTVEVWLIPPSATPPTPSPTVDPKEVKFKRGKIKRSE